MADAYSDGPELTIGLGVLTTERVRWLVTAGGLVVAGS